MIRISSQQIFSGGINRLQELNSSLNQTQEQISTGKRVNKPSDDPVAAARILKLDQELSRIETYQRNAGLAENRLQQEESALASSVDVIQRIRELTVQAGNGSLSPNDRKSISSEMKERIGQLANIANTRDASGEYIFSGFQGSTAAFGKDASGSWVYQGDEGQRVLEIDDGVTVPISDHGKGIYSSVPAAVFAESDPGNAAAARIDGIQVINDGALSAVSPDDITITVDTVAGTVSAVNSRTGDPLTVTPAAYTSGESFEVAGVQATITDAGDGDEFTLRAGERQSVFATIENLIDGLDNIDKGSPAGQAAYDDLIAASLQNLDNAQESIVQKQTEIGGRLNAVDSTKSFLEDSSVYSEDIRSQLRDVDYAEAISNLSFQSFVLQAAQQSFAQVSQLSLFDRL
ncbi:MULTISPECIES: flagellar hook-associated protein FlgL [Marinobacter]|jgi:flagellar hook-associated protein 3 FlgL|uniref:Flagellar hook-associated protein 3 n=2 Tax=Marinobacter TaxID=2742 RepID=W5YXW5_9GAMM|nr:MULTISPECIES: flagellar hook-associated protein FlgL [Marinobacter]AHI31158.1 flagellar hook-associated protein FlgL [Marinobacter salarius]ARM84460.1 flagellar hook-associated protein 3 [Marinobacter salarius]AZR43284.1 flagellar hook-associated protein [Marinobacter salarius]KXJ42330.1 MAG: flagellar biosynthesis protein FlgL [Marinobacter sp. Hex_13]MBJ7302686.1 flagellar hook-associated protein FlgL [Marinobacter salarius]